jgi:creatinine amidohydrolase
MFRNSLDMKIIEMTSPEIDALDRGVVVLLPCGAIEQHSTHLPVQTDTLLVTSVAGAAEERCASACLLLPTLWLGASHHHLAFAGTVSASADLHASNVIAIIDSLSRHRFERFLVLNGHGGNVDPISMALREMNSEQPDLMLCTASYWRLAEPEFAAIATGPEKAVGHACEIETSLMLHLAPELVRKDSIDDDFLEPSVSIPGLDIVTDFATRTEHGGRGYPSHASAEKGKRLFDAAVAATVKAISAISEGLYWREP